MRKVVEERSWLGPVDIGAIDLDAKSRQAAGRLASELAPDSRKAADGVEKPGSRAGYAAVPVRNAAQPAPAGLSRSTEIRPNNKNGGFSARHNHISFSKTLCDAIETRSSR